ncbi:MAG: ABC transporter permease [Armatimonadota bacterium]
MIDLMLFSSALRDVLRPRRAAGALVAAVLPALLGFVWRVKAGPEQFDPRMAYNTLAAGLVFGFMLTILSVLFGTSIVSQELEQKTIVYLLTRPVHRARVLLAKAAAAVIIVSVSVWMAALLLAAVVFGADGMSSPELARDLMVLALGALTYTSLALLLATLVNKAMLYGLYFAFGWESWVPMLPGSFQKVSVMTYLRVLAPHPASANAGDDLADILRALTPAETITTHTALTVVPAVIAVALAAALVVFSIREYAPRDDSS